MREEREETRASRAEGGREESGVKIAPGMSFTISVRKSKAAVDITHCLLAIERQNINERKTKKGRGLTCEPP